MTARVVRELLRRVEQAQGLVTSPKVDPNHRQNLNDAHEHLEHVRLTLVGSITSHEQRAGRDIKDVR